jgi:hypothetical protein
MKAVVGVAMVAAAAALRPQPVDLAVTLDAPDSLDGHVPAALADRVQVTTDDARAGLARRRWSVAYRGGYVREVGASQLVGPFQDPAHPPCGARVIVAQRVLDDAAPILARAIDAELAGEHVVAAGTYAGTRDVTVRWAQLVMHAEDVTFAGAAGASPGGGYIRVTATLAFERASVPVVIALVPELYGSALSFHAYARASVEVDNAALAWLAHRLGGDRVATAIARRQLDASLATTLEPPPPFALPGGGELRFVPCGAPEIHDGTLAALPFAVAIAPARGAALPPGTGVAIAPARGAALPPGTGVAIAPAAGGVLPPLAGASLPPPRVAGAIALDLDVDALNALAFELWRAGVLDRELARAGLDRRFADDPTVAELLSVRMSSPVLALPPVVTARGDLLRLAADARTTLTDGGAVTVGRVYGALAFRVAPAAHAQLAALAVDVDGVELACERDRDPARVTLVPCYADLVDALRGRAGDFHGALTDSFASLLAAIFVDQRVADPRVPAALAIRGVAPSLDAGALHLELDAALVPP